MLKHIYLNDEVDDDFIATFPALYEADMRKILIKNYLSAGKDIKDIAEADIHTFFELFEEEFDVFLTDDDEKRLYIYPISLSKCLDDPGISELEVYYDSIIKNAILVNKEPS